MLCFGDKIIPDSSTSQSYEIIVDFPIFLYNFVFGFMKDYKQIQKRRIVSALLLALYVACLTVTFAHRHEYAEQTDVACVDCANHVQNHGHIGGIDKVHDDCVLCQTLSVPVLFVPFSVFLFRRNSLFLHLSQAEPKLTVSYVSSRPLRGPPTF